MSGYLLECFFAVEVLAAGDEPDFEFFQIHVLFFLYPKGWRDSYYFIVRSMSPDHVCVRNVFLSGNLSAGALRR